MRESLRGLTTRGRAFIAAGTTALVCAVLLGQDALLRVGVLVLLLPLVTAWVMGRSRYRLSLTRDLAPHVVPVGQPARVTLRLSNEGRTPSGALLLEDRLPYVLGTRPRFVLDGIGRGWRREVTYQVRSDLRGRHEVGPMTVRVQDPFGLVEVGRAFRSTSSLVVTPPVTALPAVPLGGAGTGSGEDRPRASATGTAEDVTVREYRRGDELRRVHWPSSARMGELMVRREEQPWHSRATLFLDDRAAVHRGRGAASSLETAVAAAASVACHLAERGYVVRLVTASGAGTTVSADGGAPGSRTARAGAAPLLEQLAVVQAADVLRLDARSLADSAQGGVVVGVFGSLEQDDLAVVRRLKAGAGAALALALDVGSWSADPEPGAAPVLRHQGWRTASLGPSTRLEEAWRELGRATPSAPVPSTSAAGAPLAGRVS